MLKYKYSMHTEKYTQQIPGRPCMKSKDLLPKKKKKIPRGEKNPTNILEQQRKSSEEQKK